MESMAKKQKLRVALVATHTMTLVSVIGLATTWMNWKTIAWAFALIGSLFIQHRIVAESKRGGV